MSHFIRTETELSSVPTLSGVAKSQNTESQNTGPLPKARVKRARSQKPKSTISRGVGKRARSQNTECKTQNATGKVRKKQNTEYRTQKRSVGKLSWESEGKTQNTDIWRASVQGGIMKREDTRKYNCKIQLFIRLVHHSCWYATFVILTARASGG